LDQEKNQASYKEEPSYPTLIEVLTINSYAILHMIIYFLLTSFDFGSSYLFFWWSLCFTISATTFLIVIHYAPQVDILLVFLNGN